MPTTKTGRRRQPSASPRRARDRGAPPARAARKPARARKVEPAARRQAILDAALSVFAERGFEAARLDDVAARAGVAKGTLYLYFRDKEALFEELVRGAVSPIIEAVSKAASAPDVPASAILETFFALFQKEVLGTKRKLLLRLIIAEGPRFPKVAEFYHREVAERAVQKGEFASDAAARFPQLIVAPLILAVVWDSLFARIDPLDVAGLLRAHRELLTGKARGGRP